MSGDYVKFNLIDTALLCRIDIKQNTLHNEEVEAKCPYCNDYRYRMYLSSDQNVNQFFCHNCGAEGNAVTLYADFGPSGIRLSNYESYKALLNEPSVRKTNMPLVYSKTAEPDIRTLTERSEIYLEFLKLLRLEEKHRVNLLNRGMSEEIIEGKYYRSFPTDKTERQWICDSLSERFDLSGVPGFYKSGDTWKIVGMRSGILIPIRNKERFIQGLQIRFDNPPTRKVVTEDGITIEKTGGRFRWLSTGSKDFPCGTGITSYIHIAGDVQSDTVYLTEGGMKSDIASHLSGGRLFVGLTGVQNTRYLAQVIKSLHPKRIIECLDMDVRTNPQVRKAQSKIQAICTPLCEEYRCFTWPINQKGIDDFLLFRKLKKEYEEKIRKEREEAQK